MITLLNDSMTLSGSLRSSERISSSKGGPQNDGMALNDDTSKGNFPSDGSLSNGSLSGGLLNHDDFAPKDGPLNEGSLKDGFLNDDLDLNDSTLNGSTLSDGTLNDHGLADSECWFFGRWIFEKPLPER